MSGTRCTAASRLDGKVVLVTGGNAGIGKETVLELVKRGAHVVSACRDLAKGKQVADMVKGETGVDIIVEHLDLADTESVKKFVDSVKEKIERLDILVNNAGLMLPVKGKTTKQGFEIHMGVNHLGHHLLTHLLYPLLVSSGTKNCPSRVVNVSSDGHKFTMKKGLDIDDPDFGLAKWAYTGKTAFHRLYGQSKLAQMYHAREVSRQANKSGEHVIAVSLHPGAVATEITRYHNEGFWQSITFMIETGLNWFGKTPWEGAQTTLHCCLTDAHYLVPGSYYVDCKAVPLIPEYKDQRHQNALWQISNRLLNIQNTEE